ncbi:MAG: type II toxin-antitoxin system PemK/MazF family toxin [Gemmataceae bacterium]|nr:type II toxin-antitoxin system PemK/MazF family toxin [Gemmataceae bacterium]
MNKQRGQIWLLDLAPTIGAEISKARPAIIVSSDRVGILPLKVIVPITGWQPLFKKFPWMVRIDPDAANGLSKTSAADTFQVRSLSENRFIRKMGNASLKQLEQIKETLALVLEINT